MYQQAFEQEAEQQAPLLVLDLEAHPIVAAANILAAELAEILGPMLWAALIVLFFDAELFYR
jgi:hypothetical protein